ncbi:MAG: TIGR02300 family protein [Pseudomonadota bacterium]
MPEVEWGVKRLCPSCGARFYDLSTDPATCPACGSTFSLDALSLKRSRPERAEPKPAAKPVQAEVEDDILDDDEEEAIEVGDDVLEEDDDDETVPLEDIGERTTDETET